jgi:hypothetical protein
VIHQISCDHCVKKRQCDDENTKFGLIHTDNQHYPQTWPIIFDDILMSNVSYKNNKMKDTVFWCSDSEASLCVEGCFKTYHIK